MHVFVAFSAPPTRVSPPRLERAYAVTMRFDHFHPEIESTLTFCLSGEPPKAFLSPACDPAHNACRSAHSRGRTRRNAAPSSPSSLNIVLSHLIVWPTSIAAQWQLPSTSKPGYENSTRKSALSMGISLERTHSRKNCSPIIHRG